MPKRVQFAPGVQSPTDDNDESHSESKKSKIEELTDLKAGRFKDKHSLDSDEEDEKDEKKYGVMDAEEIEGCEDSTIDYDEGIQITPFNMNEEMEEGHFDAQGNYVWKKEDDIKDAWMDNIDWVKVKDGGGVKTSKAYNVSELIGDSSDEDADDMLMGPTDKVAEYGKMLALMRPGESVLKAIRRLGGGSSSGSKASASSRWKTKRRQQQKKTGAGGGSKAGGGGEDREGMLLLTGHADRFLQRGDVEIYEFTYEKLAHLVQQHDALVASRTAAAADGGEAMDMFSAGDVEIKPATTTTTTATAATPTTSTATDKAAGSVGDAEGAAGTGVTGVTSVTGSPPQSDDVTWEYKVSETAEAEVRGPYTSAQMEAWSEEGKFSPPVLVRKCGSSSVFYSSARIDFGLYT